MSFSGESHPEGSRTFAAAAGTPYAAEAAAEVYRAGGNAADAAVAAAAAVSITEPLMSSVGGGGFALVRSPSGEAELLDYYDAMPGKGLPREAFGAGGSPREVILKYGAGVRSIVGGAAVAVPGAIRGWERLLERHGRLTLRDTLAPAVRLAREGFLLCKTSGIWLEVAEEVLRLTDETRKNFYNGERVYRKGEEMRFPELADTLEEVSESGAKLFYEGELAARISDYVLSMGGILTRRDLAEYEPIVRPPLSVRYGASTVHTNGPPSAGGATLAQILRVVAPFDLAGMGREEYARLLAGAMRLALADRENAYVEVTENASVAARLTSEEYAEKQRLRIREAVGNPGGAFGSPHTTHLSCVDSGGLAVSITASMGYGSGLVVPGTGVPLNNTLGEPELNPRGFHALPPGERLVSSMSPTVLSGDDGVLAIGSPGASRIPTAIFQALVNVIDHGMTLEEAVYAPRLHSEGDLFAYEAGAPTADLESYGRVLAYEERSMYFGGVNAVGITPDGTFEAAADPRRSGGAAFA